MKTPSRDQLKVIYKKVKHLRLPSELETIDYSQLFYYQWIDKSDDVCFVITEKDGEIIGLRGEINRMPIRGMMHSCSICKKQREFHEIMLLTAKTKKLPKGVEYRVIGTYMCIDYVECNKDMKDGEQIVKFFEQVLG